MQQVKANMFVKHKESRQTERKKRATQGKKDLNHHKKPHFSLQYRPRTNDDDLYILRLTRDQLGDTHVRAFGEPFPEQEFLRYIQSGAPTFIIEDGSNRLGYYSYLISPDQKMHISALVIEPKSQSLGIGKFVMGQLERVALTNGAKVVEVFVQGNNERSIEFTKSLGFVEAYRFPPNTICFRKEIH